MTMPVPFASKPFAFFKPLAEGTLVDVYYYGRCLILKSKFTTVGYKYKVAVKNKGSTGSSIVSDLRLSSIYYSGIKCNVLKKGQVATKRQYAEFGLVRPRLTVSKKSVLQCRAHNYQYGHERRRNMDLCVSPAYQNNSTLATEFDGSDCFSGTVSSNGIFVERMWTHS